MNLKLDMVVRWLAFLAAVALVVLALKMPYPTRVVPLRVAVGIWPGAETLVLARERGLLPKARYNLVEVSWASAIRRALDNGVVDVAVLSLDSVLRLLDQGEALQVIYIMDESKGADAVLVQQDVTRVADLKGARVGVDVRGAGMYLLSATLAAAGLKITDVEVVPMLQAEMGAALRKGDVQAVVSAEPWKTRMVAQGASVLSDSIAVSPPIYRVLVVTKTVLQERKEDLADLLRAHIAMVPTLWESGTKKEISTVLRREGLSPAEFARALSQIRPVGVSENRLLLGAGGKGLESAAAEFEATLGIGEHWLHLLHPEVWTDDSILIAAQPEDL